MDVKHERDVGVSVPRGEPTSMGQRAAPPSEYRLPPLYPFTDPEGTLVSPSAHPAAAQGGERARGAEAWRALIAWLRANTFVPAWLPKRWQHPVSGYVAALLLQGFALAVSALLAAIYPTLAFPGILVILVVVLVAVSFGAAPSLAATLLGAGLVDLVVNPPRFSSSASSPGAWIELLLLLAVGVIVSLAASKTELARRQAERGQLRAEALARALEGEQARLMAILEAVPDPLTIHDGQGRLLLRNQAAEDGAWPDPPAHDLAHLLKQYDLRTSEGTPFALDDLPVARALRGEVVSGVEIHPRGPDAQERIVQVSAAPYRTAAGQIDGVVTVSHDIAALREAEREAAAHANELALREINQRMDEFLGIAGHELKTPLTSMKTNLQLALRRLSRAQSLGAQADDDLARAVEAARPLLDRSEVGVNRLARLVDDLLDVSRIRAGRLELRLEPVDLLDIVRQSVEEQRQLHSGRTIHLKVAARVSAPIVADADRVGQVVTNYLTNALKYSQDDRPVEVRLDVTGQQARVFVRDEGSGLSPEQQIRIWEPFHRVEGIAVQSGSGVGLGLGLHISKTIIERHDGQVGVESLPGHGATFWFTMPLATSEASDALQRDAQPDAH
jgi:signal transduction histidine kinase